MEKQHKQYVPPDIQELFELGREGKLWSLWIAYNVRSANETKLLKVPNLTGEKMKKWRESMFRFGFTIQVGDGHWKIIPPMDIVDIDMFKQGSYMPESSENTNYGIV